MKMMDSIFVTMPLTNIQLKKSKTTSIVSAYNTETYLNLVKNDYFAEAFKIASANIKYTPKINTPFHTATAYTYNAVRISFGRINTFTLSRRNSNIYKNIFPYTVKDYYDIITSKTEDSSEIITQENHGLQKLDVVAYNSNGLLEKVTNSHDYIAGVISEVHSNDKVTLMFSGYIKADLNVTKSSILYLSDTEPGKLVTNVDNNIYVPVGTYIGTGIIVNIQQASIGDSLHEYKESFYSMDAYTTEELESFITEFRQKV